MPTAVQAITGEAAPLLPAHIALIMDGNGRWATERGVTRLRGHTQGGEVIRTLLDSCRARPYIKQLTLYAFSMENWKRSKDEVDDLMNLVRHYLNRESQSLHENNVRMRFIGLMDTLAPDIRRDLEAVRELTKNNTGLTVNMAISYGARQEITHAVQQIARKVAAGELSPDAVDDALVTAHLHTGDTPDPDLLVRTGGDKRLSNFLLWQCAYTEFYFTDVLWPDFKPADLDKAVEDYSRRDRRFGRRKDA